ncbi:MAG: LppA family lipoprotein [Pseudonocardiaceae bacterium]
MALLLVSLVIAGCGTGEPSEGEKMDIRAQLAQRPSLEEITARYERMQAEVRDQISNELGPFEWVNDETRLESFCSGDFSNLGGRTMFLDRWTYEGSIPDSQWPRAVEIVTEITSRYGFGEPNVIVDKPGNHEFSGFDQYAANYTFGTAVNTTLTTDTNCHFPAAVLETMGNQPPPAEG